MTEINKMATGQISIHALLAESDWGKVKYCCNTRDFYPRSPCGERHFDRDQQNGDRADFYPRSPCGERPAKKGLWPSRNKNFYPRSPCGERPSTPDICAGRIDFYPRSPCGERRVTVLGIQHRVGISIHALLAESDVTLICEVIAVMTISIHALLAESDHQQTSSHPRNTNFYPRSPCGERLGLYLVTEKDILISIHALLAESDVFDADRPQLFS